MSRETKSKAQLLKDIDALEHRLKESEDALRAIKNGEVDAICVHGPEGDQIFTLKGSDQTYRTLIENMNQGAVTSTGDGTILYANKAFAEMIQVSYERIVGASIDQYIAPEDKPMFEALFERGIQERAEGEIAFKIHGDSPVPVYVSMNTVSLEGETVLCITATDLTEQKRQQEIVQSEKLSRAILEAAGEAILVCDHDGRIIRANHAAQRLAEDSVLLKSVDDAFQIQMVLDNYEAFAPFSVSRVLEGDSFRGQEAILRKQDRESLYFLLSASPLRNQACNIGCVLVLTDMTEQKKLERRLETEKKQMATTLYCIGDGVISTDSKGRVMLVNRVAEKLTGCLQHEAAGKPVGEAFHIINEHTRQKCENTVEKVLESGNIADLANDTILVARDGTERIISGSGAPMDLNGNIIGVVLVFRDITDRIRMEKELFKNQKLESLGILAGGIAHDFNNILTTVIGNVFLAKNQVTPDHEIFELLKEVESALARAQTLTKQLLTFGKGGTPIKETVSIKDIITESSRYVLRGSKSKCQFSIAEDLWSAEVDVGQISQVINNVVINADQAMPEGGIVHVAAENLIIAERQDLPLKPGRYIRISIKDQGVGIAAKCLSKIFDPYFTTKQGGSGLGLAAAYSIIRNHDGHITVESQLAVGTTFHIYLASAKAVPEKEEIKLIKGQGRILVMDDEVPLRKMIGRMLGVLGYEAEFARDGAEAIEKYKKAKESSNPYDAVVLDLIVPGGMGGKDCVTELLKIDPEVKAVVFSGYSEDPVLSNFQGYGFKGMMPKPFDPGLLSKVLHEVLRGKKNGGNHTHIPIAQTIIEQ
jgi:PAS domain S-box-containing protein